MKHATSPVQYFGGYVLLRDPIPLPLCYSWHKLVDELSKLPDSEPEELYEMKLAERLVEMVEEWHLSNFPDNPISVDDFPGTPKREVSELFLWLFNEVQALIKGEETVPLASSAKRTNTRQRGKIPQKT